MGHRDSYIYSGEAYTAEEYAQRESIISNGEARIPICFCVDTSSSMSIVINDKSEIREVRGTNRYDDGNNVVSVKPKYEDVKLVTRMQELQKVLCTMLDKMRSNDIIAKSAVICIITFDLFADPYIEFTDIGKIHLESLCIGRDRTNAAKGLKMALGRIDKWMHTNSDAGNDTYKPVLIFMSDGQATDGQEVRQRSEGNELNVIPIGIGNGIDERWLRGLSRESKVYYMNTDRDFEEVFAEITKKIQRLPYVIPLDESEQNIANYVQEGVASTQYGQDYNSFLEEFMNA